MHVERPTILRLRLFLNFTLFAFITHAQRPVDTAASDYALARLGADSRLYNGREYIRNGTPSRGTPYFEWDSLKPGSLDYDDISYEIPLEYDLAQDQLVIRDYSTNILISLVREKTRHFSIGPYYFRYIAPGTAHLPEPGFYQQLFTGSRITLLARRRKNLVFPSTADELAHYVPINVFYLLLDGTSSRISNEKELLETLKDKKDELKRYIRKNHLSFRRHFEESLIQTTAYYQQLKP